MKSNGDFTFYNDPCGTANRGANPYLNVKGKLEIIKNLESYNYQIDQESFICNFELNESDEITIEILDKNGKLTNHSFGIKESGQNEIILPVEKLPEGEFTVCLKVGYDQYYSQSPQ